MSEPNGSAGAVTQAQGRDVAFTAGGGPFVDEGLNQITRFAETIQYSAFVPIVARCLPSDSTETKATKNANLFFMLATAQDLGLKWTHALRGALYMTPGGRLGMEGQGMQALLLKHGFKVRFPVNTVEESECVIIRPDGESHSESFTMEDARRFQTYSKDKQKWVPLAEKDTYQNSPKAMLKWRALAACARIQAADVIGGIFLKEEADEIESAEHAETAPEQSPMGDFSVELKEDAATDSMAAASTFEQNTIADQSAAATAALTGTEEKKRRGRPAKADAVKQPAPVVEMPKPAEAAAAPAPVPFPNPPVPVPTPTPAPAAEQVPQYVVYMEERQNAPLQKVAADPAYGKPEIADARAEALHKKSGSVYVVMRIEGGRMAEHSRHGQHAVETPAKPAAVATEQASGGGSKRVAALAEALAIPHATIGRLCHLFAQGYLGFDEAQMANATKDQKREAMEVIEATAKHHKDAFTKNPLGFGRERAVWRKEVEDFASKCWKGNAVDLAVRLSYQWNMEPAKFAKWASDVIGIDFMSGEDAEACLRVCLTNRDAILPVLKALKSYRLSPQDVVREVEAVMGKPVEEARGEELYTALPIAIEGLRRPSAQDGTTVPPPAPASGLMWDEVD